VEAKRFSLNFERGYYHAQVVVFGYLFVAAISLDKQGLVLAVTAPDERELVFDCDWGWGYYHFPQPAKET
jgi:hypothetical protein